MSKNISIKLMSSKNWLFIENGVMINQNAIEFKCKLGLEKIYSDEDTHQILMKEIYNFEKLISDKINSNSKIITVIIDCDNNTITFVVRCEYKPSYNITDMQWGISDILSAYLKRKES